MPDVKPGESQNDYVERCIPIVMHEGTAKDGDQAAAICHGKWREHRKANMTPNEKLLAALTERKGKKTEFNGGILTADAYVSTLPKCVGSDLCYRYAAKGNVSFDDILKKATETLTYNNTDMLLEDTFELKSFSRSDRDLNKIELPKNTLMVFRHVLTSNRKDRDGDILRTEGMKPDPNMLMLWQHVHTLPIGKMLGIADHSSKRLSVYSAIVDLNDLAHDAATMVDNKMGRFSHGFKALEWDDNKDTDGKKTGGFDIKSAEVMEESLVSVPANVDAETEEILLSLIEGGKLTSPMMKGYGSHIREKRPTSVSITGGKIPLHVDLKLTLNGKDFDTQTNKKEEHGHEHKTTKCTGKTDCGCGCSGSPKETNADAGEEKLTHDKEVKVDEKAGKVLSAANMSKLQQARQHIEDVHNSEALMTKAGKDKCKMAHGMMSEVLASAGDTGMMTSTEVSLKDAQAMFLAKATKDERTKMIEVLETLNEIDETSERTKAYLALTGQE